MTGLVPHLLREDIRRHARLVVTWLGVVVAQPVVALIPWSSEFDAGIGAFVATTLTVARVLLGAVLVALLVQGDSPIDTAAFWRTRPISISAMAGAKIALVAAVLVLAPTVVTLAVAAWLRVPLEHWPSTVGQVVAFEGGLAAFALAVASRTRSIATFLVFGLALVAAFWLVQGSLLELRRTVAPGALRPVHPQQGLAAMAAIWALGGTALYAVSLRGARGRAAFAIGCLILALLSLGVWYLPMWRASEPTPLPLTLTFAEDSVTAVAPVNGVGDVLLVGRPAIGGTREDDDVRVVVKEGVLITPDGEFPANKAASIGAALRHQAPLLTGVPAATFRALAGRRARFEGTLHVDVQRRDVEATSPLVTGATLDTPHARLLLDEMLDEHDHRVERLRPAARGWELFLTTPFEPIRHGHSYVMRDTSSGCAVTVVATNDGQGRVMATWLLPTLAPPFWARRVVLGHLVDAPCRVEPAHAVVEMRAHLSPPATTVPVAFDFIVPASAGPARP